MKTMTQKERDAVKRRIKNAQEWYKLRRVIERCEVEAKKIVFEGQTHKEQNETKKLFWKFMDTPTHLTILLSIKQATQKHVEYLVNIGEVESNPTVQKYLSMTMTHCSHKYKNKVI